MDTSSWTRRLAKACPAKHSKSWLNHQTSTTASHTPQASLNEWWSHVENRYWPGHAARSDGIESLIDVFASLGCDQKQCCHRKSVEHIEQCEFEFPGVDMLKASQGSRCLGMKLNGLQVF